MVCLVPVDFGKAIHFDILLAPFVKKVVWYILVLMAVNVSVFPCQSAVCKFPSHLVDDIVVWLFRCVISVFKDCDKSGLTVTTDFNSPVYYVVKWGSVFASVALNKFTVGRGGGLFYIVGSGH